ncbi:sigma-70 family RNA polymerase sigma factor [bacterium]|nr:sigma-70 family RNA polymerase sigma factor [bacterium]
MFFQNKKKAFEKKVIEHLDSMYYMALKLTANETKAADLVQDTCLKALNNYNQYREDINLKAWLFKILTNTFINDYRKKKRESLLFDFDGNESIYYNWIEDNVKNRDISPDSSFFFNQLQGEIQEAIDELPEDFKTMILYADVYELSYKEIADILDAPMGTVMSKLFRARKMLQARLYNQAEQMGIIKSKKQTSKIVHLAK